jgi:putative effector of murein hydrolase LrgA (UPF0299 family)
MIFHIAILLAFQLLGEVLRNIFGLIIPGPVIGMALLLVALIISPKLAETIRGTAQGLLGHISLLFVPAGVGVVGHLGRLGQDGVGIMAAIIISTGLAILAGVGAFLLVARWMGQTISDTDEAPQ